MYLSKLEIQGFKSFAQKTKLSFNDGLTCIIGPNGSGKSNIVDAIRWVLGEQRTTSLRSDKMENVIFNGTKQRKPMGMSEVSMTIENNKKILDSEYDEIVISRRLFRSGESQYLINKTPVRLKDVLDLFMDTGMGANSYSVIELKMVESIISDNKHERRLLFEEAAGVVKYKTRRKSALRKLESTQQDLARINDIVIEVEKTVSSLSRQVSKARRYISLTDELKKAEIDLATYRYHQLKDRITPLENELSVISKEKEESSHQITLEEAILEDYNRQTIAFEQKMQDLNQKLYDKDNAVRQLNQEDAIAQAKIEDMKNNRERYGAEIDDFSKKITILQNDKTTYSDEIVSLQQNYDTLQKQFDDIARERNEKMAIINAEKAEIDRLNNEFRSQLQNLSEEKETLKQKEYRINFENEQIDKINTIHSEQSSESSHIKDQIKEKELNKGQKESELKELNNEFEKIKQHTIAIQENINDRQAKFTNIVSELERIKSRETFYHNIIANYEGHSKSTQFVMSQKDRIAGVHGPLSELINTSDKYAFLVESILKDSVNYVVVENVATAQNLIKLIKNEKQGRITCIPLDRIKNIARPNLDKSSGLTYLLDNISCDQKFEHLLYILLGDVVVVGSLHEAIESSANYPGLRFITHEGEMVNFNREISGGVSEKKDTAIIGRKNKLAELAGEKAKLEKELDGVKNELDKAQKDLEKNSELLKTKRDEWDTRQREFYEIDNDLKQLNYQYGSKEKQLEAADVQVGQLKENIARLHNEIGSISQNLEQKQQSLNNLEKDTISRTKEFETKNEKFQILLEEYQQIQLKLSNANNQLTNRQNDIQRIAENINELENSIKHRQQEIENIKKALIQFDEDIKNRKEKRETLWEERDILDKEKQVQETELQSLKDKRHELENEIREFRRKHDNSLEKSKKLEIQISEYKYESEAIRNTISREHTTDVDALIPNENLDEAETEENIDSLRARIKNLGLVNPLAVSEYEKESERLEFLVTQKDDLEKAEKSLLETIDKINKTARKQFVDTFNQIKANFEKVFISFFPNGRGTINLDASGDPLEADIDIEVTTKGRGLQTLSLLSGGEKTLTAISLLFSIYLVKPSPFCILDEVDAPLDDVNIGRFTEALKGFSNNTQFLVVTHNKRTMEAAKTMYGVTMEEEGVSKLVSVKFN